MRTRFSNEDVKVIIENIFNGNLRQHQMNPNVAYVNENSENIYLINEDTGEQEQKDLAEYLNIHFYTWKNRVVETSQLGIDDRLTPFDSWVQSLNISMNSAVALIETIDEEVIVSQDIDDCTKQIKITFLMQTDKVANLDYYLTKIRNDYLGKVQDLYNAYNKKLKAYINIGTLIYEGEPQTIQYGSCIQCSCNVELSYMADALTNEDIKVSMSLDGLEGEYLEMPITKSTYQMIVTGNAEPTMSRPDLTGVVGTTISWVKSFTFFDFNTELNNRLNDIFWQHGAYAIDNVLTDVKSPNIVVFIKVETNGKSYIYKDIITQIEKSVTNSDFNVCTMQLKGYGKTI